MTDNMEYQENLDGQNKKRLERKLIPLDKNKVTLEHEKAKLIENMCEFIERMNLTLTVGFGRPKADLKDIIKSLLIMSYHSMSYRRAETDIKQMYEQGLISTMVPRSTLNDYANKLEIVELLERLIQFSSIFFIDNENTLIIDSTWFAKRMYGGGYKQVYDKTLGSLYKVRKVHLACAKESKIITFAKATPGTVSDFKFFEEAVRTTCKNGFVITKLLADAGYSSKNNYTICKELGILDTFIDFKSSVTGKRGKSDLWREKVKMWKEQKAEWKDTYRFRVIIEGVISAIKRKNINYLRSKKETAQDVEILLKVLVYNLTVIGRYS